MAKVHIQFKPSFVVELNDLEFKKVTEHATLHYDVVCQSATYKANGIVTNGFLTIAAMCKQPDQPYYLRLSSREFDTLCKICEFSRDKHIRYLKIQLIEIGKQAWDEACRHSENNTHMLDATA